MRFVHVRRCEEHYEVGNLFIRRRTFTDMLCDDYMRYTPLYEYFGF